MIFIRAQWRMRPQFSAYQPGIVALPPSCTDENHSRFRYFQIGKKKTNKQHRHIQAVGPPMPNLSRVTVSWIWGGGLSYPIIYEHTKHHFLEGCRSARVGHVTIIEHGKEKSIWTSHYWPTLYQQHMLLQVDIVLLYYQNATF